MIDVSVQKTGEGKIVKKKNQPTLEIAILRST